MPYEQRGRNLPSKRSHPFTLLRSLVLLRVYPLAGLHAPWEQRDDGHHPSILLFHRHVLKGYALQNHHHTQDAISILLFTKLFIMQFLMSCIFLFLVFVLINGCQAFVSQTLQYPSYHHQHGRPIHTLYHVSNRPIRRQLSTQLYLMKVLIRIVGRKPSERWLEEGVNMYQQRLTKVMELQTEWHKSNSALIQNVEQDLRKEHVVVLLDPSQGKQYKSEDFAEYFYQWMQQGGSRLVFVIGGAEGLPTELLDKTDLPKVSLSKLTFTHQMTRLLLAEQVYRAYEIHKGSEYHK